MQTLQILSKSNFLISIMVLDRVKNSMVNQEYHTQVSYINEISKIFLVMCHKVKFSIHPLKFTMGVKLRVKVRQLETMIMLSWANHIQHPQVPYIFGISMTRRVCLQNVNVLGLPHVVQEPPSPWGPCP